MRNQANLFTDLLKKTPGDVPPDYRTLTNKTCKNCSEKFAPKSGRQDYCTAECKKQFTSKIKQQRILYCLECSTSFTPTGSTSKFCSSECRTIFSKKANRIPRTCLGCDTDMTMENMSKLYCTSGCSRRHKSYLEHTGVEGIDYIACPICSQRVKQITQKHAAMHGYNSIHDMASNNNMTTITCESIKELYQGENNPGYQHGGKFSPWSQKFINGYDADKHDSQKQQFSELKLANKHLFKNNLEYWIEHTNGDIDQAKILYKQFQTKDLDSFIKIYGEEEGKVHHMAKTEKWIKSYKKSNFSKVSQELFNEIATLIDTSYVYYATFPRDDMSEYVNKEYIMKLPTTYIRPDFIDLKLKKVIEFDGDYWHSEHVANPTREKLRDEMIISNGYDILHVQEHEYKKDKQKVIEECINFLKT